MSNDNSASNNDTIEQQRLMGVSLRKNEVMLESTIQSQMPDKPSGIENYFDKLMKKKKENQKIGAMMNGYIDLDDPNSVALNSESLGIAYQNNPNM